eukprot:GEMP01031653.1.p1 GENE.GEMP01031653.1~~GEMP01031653.1.p1  ORF type:complete len:636 (+),score=180.49 GEMP01031653.1:51-1910(+)
MATNSPKRMKRCIDSFIDSKNKEYEHLHRSFEEQFWGTKMNLASGFSTDELTSTKVAMEVWLRAPSHLEETEKLLKCPDVTDTQKTVLNIFQRTFSAYQMDPKASAIRDFVTKTESELENKYRLMPMGYKLKGEFTEATIGQLRQKFLDPDEDLRKAAFDGICTIGPFIIKEGFLDVVKGRNNLAKTLGYQDFYDYKVTQAEGFGKDVLFKIMDDLERKTRPILDAAIEQLKKEKGEAALKPWNRRFVLSGETEKQQDPYFPFGQAVSNWAKCFARLGIDYKDATLNLDLLDRKGKYNNGFCHWPQPAWRKPDNVWQPSTANFTSLANPKDIGSGKVALTTLMHEAGHAAHFANVDMKSPLFSQERAPTSVAYAENQSMFLDSLCEDADWIARYALDKDGKAMPWELIEAAIRSTHHYRVFQLRGMIAVPYFEKRLYEMPDAELTPERILKLAEEVELEIQGCASPRPLLSVPHILSDESSCYYHGYVLAEMSVWQTRKHFLDNFGYLTDNPKIGPALRDGYWKCGNSEMFLDLVHGLTGHHLVADAWVEVLKQSLEDRLAQEKKDYEKALAAPAIPASPEALKMCLRLVHGDEVISDSRADGFEKALAKFEEYVDKMP